jgi:uncharacterized membrane protein
VKVGRVSISSIREGLGGIFSTFRIKDPVKRGIVESTTLIEKMLRTLESSRRSLETLAEEYKKRVKTPGQESEIARIIDEEVKNIYAYLSLITKTIHDLTRVKYRLETLFYIEEPLKVIPEILTELKNIEPELEKINPQLLTHIRALEQRVASILAVTSPVNNIGVTLQLPPSRESETSQQTVPTKLQSTNNIVSSSKIAEKESRVERSIIKPLEAQNTPIDIRQQVLEPTQKHVEVEASLIEIPLHVLEQWVLNELKITAGILDLGVFEKKYGVSRKRVLEALASLEAKGLVKIRRR